MTEKNSKQNKELLPKNNPANKFYNEKDDLEEELLINNQNPFMKSNETAGITEIQ